MKVLFQLLIICAISMVYGNDVISSHIGSPGGRNLCPSGSASECPVPERSVCLKPPGDSRFECFKTCSSNGDCAQAFVCNYEGLCKPEDCPECIAGPTYPTTAPEEEEEADEISADIGSPGGRNVCPSGSASECPVPERSVCLKPPGDRKFKCFKTCAIDEDCARAFVCNYEGLCKPEDCPDCIAGPTYPTGAPEEADGDIFAMLMGENTSSELLTTSFLVKVIGFIVFGLLLVFTCSKVWNTARYKGYKQLKPSTYSTFESI